MPRRINCEIVKVYSSYIRPVIEYASCIYGPLLINRNGSKHYNAAR